MALSPEELAEFIYLFNMSITLEVIIYLDIYRVGFISAYIYHYLATFAEEVSSIWPQRWRTGKVLFVIARYVPMALIVLLVLEMRVWVIYTPKACEGISHGVHITSKLSCTAAELVLLLCLHALLGARRRYLVLMIAVYLGLTLGAIGLLVKIYSEEARALPATRLDRDLGYPCEWVGEFSPAAIRGRIMASYVAFTKAVCIAVFALTVLYIRYRTQAGSLIRVIRRDGGAYIFAFTAIRLAHTLIAAFGVGRGHEFYSFSVPALNFAAPSLACRLLLNMQQSEDPDVQTRVTSIMFEGGGPDHSGESVNEEEDMSGEPKGRIAYAGIGQRRKLEKESSEISDSV
ncbi:hypothetical protein DFP72DRAFT_914614 [Ephemerocybe angulata]|uniref:DUF6533 domain-containing protein n=1 Tax=Ephemerocybe angulata TaxID=980116 RepID=A0A8H6HMC3_9AGAR|nr:hypothetical protein DFP72DRAFT_914614 [Tulosesus angulatus]